MAHSNKPERSTGSMQGLRALAAQFDGMQCYYCKVPTAATIEHVKAFSEGGKTHISNLKVACPYCNTKKGKMSVEDFIESKRWKMPPLDPLPESVRALLFERYNYQNGQGIIQTTSIHSRLKLKGDLVYIEVRAGKKYPWQEIKLGKETNPGVVAASYDFLERHYTTEKTANKKLPRGLKPF